MDPMDTAFDVVTHLEMLRDMDGRQCRLTLATLVGQNPAAFEKAVLQCAQYLYPITEGDLPDGGFDQ